MTLVDLNLTPSHYTGKAGPRPGNSMLRWRHCSWRRLFALGGRTLPPGRSPCAGLSQPLPFPRGQCSLITHVQIACVSPRWISRDLMLNEVWPGGPRDQALCGFVPKSTISSLWTAGNAVLIKPRLGVSKFDWHAVLAGLTTVSTDGSCQSHLNSKRLEEARSRIVPGHHPLRPSG